VRDRADGRRLDGSFRKVGLVAVALAACLLVANVARIGVDATRDLLEHDSIAATYAASDTQRCVQAKIDGEIPPGAAIAIRSSNPLWFERGRTDSYPRYEVTTEARATYVVTVAARGDTCDLVDVQVSRTR
jgi:hypothetical protein